MSGRNRILEIELKFRELLNTIAGRMGPPNQSQRKAIGAPPLHDLYSQLMESRSVYKSQDRKGIEIWKDRSASRN